MGQIKSFIYAGKRNHRRNCISSAKDTSYTLKGYSCVSLIHGLTHLDTKYAPPPWDKVFGPLAYVVLACSEMTAQQQYTAVNGSKYKSPSKSHK